MKIRTKEQLCDLISGDLGWRKKELTTLLNEVKTAKSKRLPTALRSGIVLLYAHWEGFIKFAAESYLNFVQYRKLKLNELDTCFLSVAIKQKIKQFEDTSKATSHVQFVDFLFNKLDERAKINTSDVIKTNSNLNYSTLRELLTTIGIDCTQFELKENLIDSQLLNYRNSIAHGQELLLDSDEYLVIHDEIFKMLNEISNLIQNAATMDLYKKSA